MRFFVLAIPLVAAACSAPKNNLSTNTFQSNPFAEAFEVCQDREGVHVEAGLEISPYPLKLVDGKWKIIWVRGDDVITEYVTSDTPSIHVHEGRQPFAVRFDGQLLMEVPYPATVDEDISCPVERF